MNAISPPHKVEMDVLRVFEPLISQFAFKHVRTSVYSYEWCVVFESAMTRVNVFFELGIGPWIQIGPLTGPDYDLRFLLEELGREQPPPLASRNANDPRISEYLETLSDLLFSYGKDILRGDFEMLPRIRLRAEEHQRRRNQEE